MSFSQRIRPAVTRELSAARNCTDPETAFGHLERAHVLGQASTRQHVRAHWAMLLWGWQNRDWREVCGQVMRLVGAASKTAFGLVPSGNTGGSNISPWRQLPVPHDLAAEIENARQGAAKF